MSFFNAKSLVNSFHLLAAGIALYTFTQGSSGYNAGSGFEPGLASGKWAVRLLLLSLSMTPFQTYFRWRQAHRFHKPAGLWSFAFAVAHVSFYLDGIRISWASLTRPYFLTLGLVGFVILAGLAATSSQWAMRILGRNWKRLHRLVYLAGGTVVGHALLSISMSKKLLLRDPQAPSELRIYLALLVVLLLVRIPQVKRLLRQIRKTQFIRTPVKPILEKKQEAGIQIRYLGKSRGHRRQSGLVDPRRKKEPIPEAQPREKLPVWPGDTR